MSAAKRLAEANHKSFFPKHFLNREMSWLEFNARVLEEARDETNPLFERVKFLSIFSSNLDEFFMVRVAGLREQAFGDGAPQDFSPDGLRAIEQLVRISQRTRSLVAEQYDCWNNSVRPRLAEEGIRIHRQTELSQPQLDMVEAFFRDRAYPILTPMAVDPSHPSPRYHNRGLYLGAMLKRHRGLGPRRLFAVVQLPQVLPRLVPVDPAGTSDFVLLEDVISSRLANLFGGFDIECWTTFRITRDNDIELLEQESDDMLRLIEERLKARQQAEAVRLEVADGADPDLLRLIIEDESLRVAASDDQQTYNEVYPIPGPLDLTALMAMTKGPGKDNLRVEPFIPQSTRGIRWGRGADFFAAIARQDILLHHPYDSFEPVAEFIRRAASDANVLAIKQTLYRAGGDSPIIRSLMEAAEHGKHVTALVELKARFDEEANVSWARQLERAGVHVVFGFLDLKTHCKLSMVIRQEGDRVRRYVHLGTGNYNSVTAQQYTDLGLFTADEDMAADASALFNLLTGYSQGHVYRKLIVAPQELHARTIELIEEQARLARKGKGSWIFAKLNALADYRVIEALYRASQAGVPIDLVVRGICCLRPGMPGISETIRVRSIVDRFLEHSRIFVFNRPDENPKVFLASADWMPRNFYRRVEVMFPVEAPALRQRILTEIVPAYLADNVKSRELAADGTYHRVRPVRGKKPFRCQQELLRTHPLGLKAAVISPVSLANGRAAAESSGDNSVGRMVRHQGEPARRTTGRAKKHPGR